MIFKYCNARDEFIYNLELTIRHFELLGEERRDSFSCAFTRLSRYQTYFLRYTASSIQESNIKRWFLDLLRGYPFMATNEIQRALNEIKAEMESHRNHVSLLDEESGSEDDEGIPSAHAVCVSGAVGKLSKDKKRLVASLKTILSLDEITKIRQEASSALSQYG